MSRHGYGHGHGGDGLEYAAGGIVGICIVLAVIAFVLMVRAIVYIVQTFRRYGRESKGLWKSLYIFLACVVLAGVLGLLFQHQPSLEQVVEIIPSIGFVQLLLVCKSVQTEYSQAVMKEQYSIVSDCLRRDWWSSYDDTTVAA